jgi:hypothetical protein
MSCGISQSFPLPETKMRGDVFQSLSRDILRRNVASDIMPVPQGDIMEDLRLWVPQEVVSKLYVFRHDQNKAVNAWGR